MTQPRRHFSHSGIGIHIDNLSQPRVRATSRRRINFLSFEMVCLLVCFAGCLGMAVGAMLARL